ncbi:hypothetical protein [Deinococcus sp. AJ005]|uniref:hypothetical protein n=1 Tax=Deinococcus sp. AJ005 TaxID=2652443 RepID=UPI00125CA8DE|nr:hypothetical protein [Deinococcus sp. AJ005]QFP76824.1 hypothetical protein DAAJ005_10425 [Deinococcus sp. AJ005]
MKPANLHYMRLVGVLGLLAMSNYPNANSQVYDELEIIKIRENYKFVNSQIDSRAYTRSTKELPYCQGRIDQKREIWTDKNGTLRKYSQSGGSDDSFTSADYYFDYKKRLDFILIQHNNVHGISAELRVYYDDSGKIIRSTQSRSSVAEDFWQAISSNPTALFTASYQCDH